MGLKITISAITASILVSIGAIMKSTGETLNNKNVNNKFTDYLKDKGEVLMNVRYEINDYLYSIIKATEVNKEFDKQLDLIKNKKSNINKEQINFPKTEFPKIDLASEKEYNRLLKLRDQILKEIQTPQENYTNQLKLYSIKLNNYIIII